MPVDRVQRWRDRLRKIGESLPEAEVSGDQHLAFRVRGKSFAYFLVDHHGDGRMGLAYKAPPGVQAELLDAEPERFYVPAYVGSRGWVGLDLEAADIDWPEVTAMLPDAYRLSAPKHLAQQVL